MTNNFSLLIKKYSVPVLFLILALAMLYINFASEHRQDASFILATIMMFVAGALTLLYSTGTISTKILTVLGGLAFIGAVITLYFSTASVVSTKKHNEQYELSFGKAAYNLSDIREAQKAYLDKNGKYADTWDKLLDFIRNGEVPYVNKVGVIPNRKITPEERAKLYGDNRPIDVNMTEMEALLLSKMPNPASDLAEFKRDTLMKSYMESKFNTKTYREARELAGYGKFSVDSLAYIPFTNKKWNMQTKDSVKIGQQSYPAIKVWGKLPYAKLEGTDPIEISFGSLTTNDVGGSWESN